MKHKMGFGGIAFSVGVYIALTLALVVWLYPLLFILSSSISDWLALEQGRVRLLPVGLEFSSYQFIIAQKPMVRAFFNSAFYSASRALLTLALLAPLAYALSERKLRGRNFLTVLLLITMLFGAGMIPMYMVVRWAGLLNTRWAIIIPQLFSFWYVILLRTSFASIPDELKESAYIDGASNWTVFSRIVLPLSKPILATIGLFAGVRAWNDFFSPLLYLQDKEFWPLTIVLRNVVMLATFPQGEAGEADMYQSAGFWIQAQMAVIVINIVPVLIVYPFLQRYFTKGIMLGAVKG